jgi:hypothetical protein
MEPRRPAALIDQSRDRETRLLEIVANVLERARRTAVFVPLRVRAPEGRYGHEDGEAQRSLP